jgi:hypothetical protein
MNYKLGDLIESYAQACNIDNLTVNDVSGINRDKEFFSPAKQVGANTSKYKIVPPKYFACNLMHVGRDIVLPISLNTTSKNKIVSPAYTIFRVKDEKKLLSEYLFMWLKSDEKDRFFWLYTDSSVRDGLAWEDLCNIEINLPPLTVQQKYVAVYQAMLANQQAYEQGLDDLKLVCDVNLDSFKKKYPYIEMSSLLQEIDNRNSELEVENLQGININKVFMPSLASVSKDNLCKYKIVQKNQFAYSAMQTGRDKCIRIALYNQNEPCIISPAYSVLEVKTKSVLAEYIMLWFSRKESDRYGWFISDSSIRASLELSSFNQIKIPLPPPDVQQAIVNIYTVLLERRAINEQLKKQIKEICPILVRGAIGEMTNDKVL